MRESVTLEQLGQLLVNLNRSLLQYAIDVWPWGRGSSGDDVRKTIATIASHQRGSVERLAETLDAAGVQIDFGVFPDEYTSLHFVAVAYLLDQILENQQRLVLECQEAVALATRDSDLGPLLSAIRDNEKRVLDELVALQSSLASAVG